MEENNPKCTGNPIQYICCIHEQVGISLFGSNVHRRDSSHGCRANGY